MSLRKHQREFETTINKIANGLNIRTIYCHVTPGGGKSILPIIAGRLIGFANRADKLCWIAPRLSLINQAEREFINPYFRHFLGHELEIRSSTNENNPSRNLNGFATTYNAVGMDEGILESEFERYRYILIMDEFHHVALESVWHAALAPLFRLAAVRVMMTGTCERGDGQKIAFMPYRQNGCGLVPDLKDTPDTAVIRYTRADALAERAIIPLAFHLSDGQASWQTRAGQVKKVQSLDRMSDFDATKALYTALRTEYAEDLLKAGLAHWQEHRKTNPEAKCLVVCSDIKQAERHTKNLKEWGLTRLDIATSDDSASALKAINKMKAGRLDVLVTVAMAYEGLSIPAVSHIICLTRIRSTPWIEQMTARANRIDPNGGPYDQQIGHIFAPADPLFKEIVSRIEAEQLPILQQRQRAKDERDRSENEGFSLECAPGGITPLSSAMTGNREVILNGNMEISTRTASEIEAELRKAIEEHVNLYAYQNRYNPKRLNGELYEHFGKPRREMTIAELQECERYIKRVWPLSYIRGTGRPRVPTKAKPFACEWK